jgi:hypothetical protein
MERRSQFFFSGRGEALKVLDLTDTVCFEVDE